MGEIEARNIIIDRLSDSVCPQTYEKYTAKQLCESVAKTRSEAATASYSLALETLLTTRFTGSPNDYCDRFLANLQSINSAADALISDSSTLEPTQSEYTILPGQAAVLFSLGTKGVGWLDNWRDTKAIESDNKFSSLEYMMSSLRTVAGNRTQITPRITAAAEVGTNDIKNPNDYCTLCSHKHKNKQCFKQHPELAKARRVNQGRRGRKGKGKARALTGECDGIRSDSDSDSEDTAIFGMCASRSNEIPSLYDTGASHHFVPSRSDFISLRERSRPFKFDQAVGAMSLKYQGTARLKIGFLKLKLQDCLYSPNSSCNIISAVRLQRLGNVVPDCDNTMLVQKQKGQPDKPVARLIPKNDVLYIHPLDPHHLTTESNAVAAPGVARVPKSTNAQRWHQRLGHTGQKILRKTADCSLGMEGIDMGDLSTCETCHLSKAQRFVSRGPRPIPNEPLDEVFIDTVGKVTESYNKQKYIVIITDAKTRMRWALTTQTKDQIALQLV